MDLNGVEGIRFAALGGTNKIVVNDLSKTDVKQVAIDLAASLGGTTGDGQTDTVTVNGSNGKDQIIVSAAAATVTVSGLSEQVTLDHADAGDRLLISSSAGNDTIDASMVAAGTISLTLDRGAGNDIITGSAGNDVILGGDGNDTVAGGRGADVAFLVAGNDLFTWNPGDGSDVVEGQDGTDTLLFNGSNVGENITISANGSRALFTRDVAAITMDLNGVEHIQFNALSGADNIVVNDSTGTDVTQVAIDLASPAGSAVSDGQPDTVIVNATAGDDHVNVVNVHASVAVKGLSAQVTIDGADSGNDALVVNGGAGSDVINASTLAADHVNLTMNGGAGDDVIHGSHGNDTVVGGTGNDTASLGEGDDTFVWNPGDGNDTVNGQAGTDTLQFNGANINENIDISANGAHATFFRNVANITMDLNNVETINFKALGGADNATVNDLSKTDVTKVNVDLAATGGGGDGQVDTIVINATNGADTITVANNDGVVTVSGLAATVTISGFEATDRLVINGLGGDDAIVATGLGTAMQFTADGGDGNDVLVGTAGNNTLHGGAGDDILIGNGGVDVLDGGSGNNVVINSLVASLASQHSGDFLLS